MGEVTLRFPIQGYDVSAGVGSDGTRTPKAMNVWPYDFNGRICGAVRPGLSLFTTDTFSGGVTAMASSTFNVQGSDSVKVVIVATGTGSINYTGSVGTAPFANVPMTAGVSNVAAGATIICSAAKVYIVDGREHIRTFEFTNSTYPGGTFAPGQSPPPSDPRDLTVGSLSYANLVATAGTPPKWCKFGTLWRDRLVVAGNPRTPFLVFASKVGTPTDWDSASDSPDAAWVLNAAQAGRIGDSVTALMPLTDDTLLIGGTNSLYRLDGDPTDGGSLSLVSTSIGVHGPFAWCQSDTGAVYFVGPSGLYGYGGGAPKSLGNSRLGQYWRAICTGDYDIRLVYEPVRNGVWVFPTSRATGNAEIGLWYDIGLDAFFPLIFGHGQTGPLCAMWHHDETGARRGAVLGGSDGRMRRLNSYGCGVADVVSPGVSVAIQSAVLLGPLMLSGDLDRVKSFELEMTCGSNLALAPSLFSTTVTGTGNTLAAIGTSYADSDFNLDYAMLSGPDPVTVSRFEVTTDNFVIVSDLTVTPQQVRISQWGYSPPQRHRTNGNSMALALWNGVAGKTWSFERAAVVLAAAGRVR